MVRPNKPGLEYFPLDCVMDDKTELIEAKYGIAGFGIIIKLFQKIYSQGYYYRWAEEESLLFSKKVNVDNNLLNDIINDCLRWDLFKKCIHEKYGVLTSRGIQKRYIEATFRRKEVEIERALLLVTITEKMRHVTIVQNEFMYTETPVNVDVKETETPQSKVKKRKVKKRKVKKSKVKKSMNVFIPPKIEEVIDYCQERQKGVDPQKWYDFYSAKGWMIGKNKMKDWKAAVRTWERNAKNNFQNQKPHKMTSDEATDIWLSMTEGYLP